MAGLGPVIVVAAVIASMSVALYMYTEYQTNFIQAAEGEPVAVGPVEYAVIFDGTHAGNKDRAPDNTFVRIKIEAENISSEETRISGGQFYLVDENDQNHRAIYGGFSPTDLLNEPLEPGKPTSWTTQFDVPYDEEIQYHIVIRPSKEHTTTDTARICISNC